jgi:hypothetical protein
LRHRNALNDSLAEVIRCENRMFLALAGMP